MPVKKVDKIWMNGKLVNWDDANIHVMSHVIHYGSSWFEGIRCYDTAKGPAIFRLDGHIRRLFDSTKIYRTQIPYTEKQIEDAITHIAAAVGAEDAAKKLTAWMETRLAAVWVDLVLLAIYGLLFFTAAYVKFLRYDVR